MSDRESRGVRSQIFSQISIITHKRFYLRATKFGMMAHVSSSVFLGDHPRPRLIFHWGQGRKAENQGRTSEGRERNGLLGRGQQAPPHQLWGLGSAVSSRHGVYCEIQTAQMFSTIFSTQDGLSLHLILLIVDYQAAIGGQAPCATLAHESGEACF